MFASSITSAWRRPTNRLGPIDTMPPASADSARCSRSTAVSNAPSSSSLRACSHSCTSSCERVRLNRLSSCVVTNSCGVGMARRVCAQSGSSAVDTIKGSSVRVRFTGGGVGRRSGRGALLRNGSVPGVDRKDAGSRCCRYPGSGPGFLAGLSSRGWTCGVLRQGPWSGLRSSARVCAGSTPPRGGRAARAAKPSDPTRDACASPRGSRRPCGS